MEPKRRSYMGTAHPPFNTKPVLRSPRGTPPPPSQYLVFLHDRLDYGGKPKQQRLGRVMLSNADWNIEIQRLPSTTKLTEELNEKGGYAITHVGRLTRRDGRSFAISKAEQALGGLHPTSNSLGPKKVGVNSDTS